MITSAAISEWDVLNCKALEAGETTMLPAQHPNIALAPEVGLAIEHELPDDLAPAIFGLEKLVASENETEVARLLVITCSSQEEKQDADIGIGVLLQGPALGSA